MKYLCLGYHDEQAWQTLSDDERNALVEASLAYEGALRRAGHVLSATALERASAAATLRFDGGEMSVTDGPFAETKEQLGGAMLLEASDLNQAIQLMSQVPCMRLGGSIEIRPVNEALSTQNDAITSAAGVGE
jgi:hypothetical protein